VSEAITYEKRRRELANRVSNGIEVTLLWGPSTGEVVVEVIDHSAEQAFELTVPSERALDAFHHPYAYASRQGVEYEALLPQAA
jgi:predicted metal-dependent phosphoesterase TrpH